MEQLNLVPKPQLVTRKEKAIMSVQFSTDFPAYFSDWLEDNWHVYQKFEAITFKLINRGRKHIGSMMIVNKIRWETVVEENNSTFKINNNLAPYLARLFCLLNPLHAEFFKIRERRTA